MRGWIFGIVALLFAVNAPPARADWLEYYGAVVCEGNAAMVRFAATYDENEIAFAPPPAPFARLFRTAQVEDPSRCRLSDGRMVTFHQSDDADAKPYGAGGGISTQWFTLTIGDRVIYDHEVFDSRAEPRADLVVVFDGARITECRTQEGDPWSVHDIPLACTDKTSERLPGAPLVRAPDRQRLELDRFAPGNEGFCEALLQPNPSTFMLRTPWPAYIPPYPSNAVSFGDAETPERFDLDNDGVIDRPIAIEAETHYFDGRFWVLPPPGVPPTQEELNAVRDRVTDDGAPALRQAGWRIFSGDQTVFEEERYVWLWPGFRDGVTYFTATWAIPRGDPNTLVLRSHPDGTLEEICAFGYER